MELKHGLTEEELDAKLGKTSAQVTQRSGGTLFGWLCDTVCCLQLADMGVKLKNLSAGTELITKEEREHVEKVRLACCCKDVLRWRECKSV